MMNRFICVCATLLLAGTALHAQNRDISLIGAVNVPMYKEIESDATIGLSYGQFYKNGLGFRAGIQWSPSVADVNSVYGLPVAVSYRTRIKSTRERLYLGAQGAARSLDQFGVYSDDRARSVAGGFLANLFSDMEFFLGVTPGFIGGTSSSVSRVSYGNVSQERWVEKKTPVSLSLDAGFCVNFGIKRFDLKFMPAFHYNLLDSLVYHQSSGAAGVDRQSSLRWFFSMGFGIAYRF